VRDYPGLAILAALPVISQIVDIGFRVHGFIVSILRLFKPERKGRKRRRGEFMTKPPREFGGAEISK
jgi:hypothetical protein